VERSAISYYRGCPAHSPVAAPTELANVGLKCFQST